MLNESVGQNSTPNRAAKATSASRDGGEAPAIFGADGTANISDGNMILGIKEEVVSSGNSSYYSGEDVAGDVASMNIGLE